MVVAIVFAFNVQSQNWKDIKNKATKNVENNSGNSGTQSTNSTSTTSSNSTASSSSNFNGTPGVNKSTGTTVCNTVGTAITKPATIAKQSVIIAPIQPKSGKVKGVVMRSVDAGKTWATVLEDFQNDLTCAAYGNGLFMVVGKNRAYISYTGEEDSWEEIDISKMYTANGNFDPVAMCFGNGFFVVVGGSGTFNYTKDGKTWQHIEKLDDMNLSKSHYKNIEFINNKFFVTGNANRIITLTVDGDKLSVEKASQMSTDVGDHLSTVAYNGNTYVAFRYYAYKSKDGLNWKQFNPTCKMGASMLYIIPASDGTFIAAKEMGGIAYSKDNGNTWTIADGIKSDDIYAPHIRDIVNFNNKYIAIGLSCNVWTSDDGVKWTEIGNDKIKDARVFQMTAANIGM